MERTLDCLLLCGKSLLRAVTVAAAEFVDATGGIDEFLLAGEEGVRGRGDLEFYEGILFAIDFDSLTGCHSRASDESLVVRHIFEHNLTVVRGMNFLFHF